MRFQNAVLGLLPTMYLTTVMFNTSNKGYTYLSRFKSDVGDTVIVNSPTTGMTCVRVVSCEKKHLDVNAEYQYQLIIDKVDTTKHNEFMRSVNELTEEIHQKQQADRLKEVKKMFGIKKGDKLSKMLDAFRFDD